MLTMREIIRTFYNALSQNFSKKLKNHRGNWNQNDPTADDYIKNRPFYKSDDLVTLVNTTFTTYNDYEWCAPFYFEIIKGTTYYVTYNGIQYQCKAHMNQYGETCIGNMAVIGEGTDTGEPFLYIQFNADGGVIVEKAGTHTISIKTKKIVKINKEFLPNDLVSIDEISDAFEHVYDEMYSIPNVSYGYIQNLSTAEKTTARNNIGAVSSDEITGVVKYSESQTLTNAQKTQARTNIGAGTSSFDGKYTSLTEKPNAVLFDTQTLTSAQKTQARQNIGAGTSSFSGSYYDLTNKPTIDWNAKSGYGHIENRVCYEDITDNSADLPHFTTTEVATNSDGQRVYYAYYAECEKTILATHPSELYADGLSVFLPSYYVGWFSNSATVDVYGNPRLFKILTNTSVVSAYGTFIGNQNLDIDNGMDYCIAVVCIGSFWPCFAISTTKDVSFGKIYHRIIDLKQLDEKFIPDTIARVTDIPTQTGSWNDLTDKPFGETGATITWNGDTGSVEYFTGNYYWMSPLTPTFEELKENEAICNTYNLADIGTYLVSSESYSSWYTEFDSGYKWNSYFVVVFEDNATDGEIIFPKKGIYFRRSNPMNYTSSLVWGGIETLDDKFIPNTIQRVGDDLILNSSTEGSIKKFKLTIDDSGVLTATEIVE